MARRFQLHTDRLLLRPFERGDVGDALAYRNDEQFARFLPHIPQPFTTQDAEAFVALNMALDWERSPTFAVVLRSRVIGTVNLEVDDARTAMIGFAISRSCWGQGIATEAAKAATAWAMKRFVLRRIWGSTDSRNLRSQRVLEKLGLRREALRVRDHAGRNGEPVDEVVFSHDFAR